MFSTFVGLGRLISCQRPDYTITKLHVNYQRDLFSGIFPEFFFNCLFRKAFL